MLDLQRVRTMTSVMVYIVYCRSGVEDPVSWISLRTMTSVMDCIVYCRSGVEDPVCWICRE